MFKLIIGVLLLFTIANYEGVDTYINVETLSDLGSLMNIYLTSITAIVLMAFGIDEIRR
mgnify:CR=1 FL=1